MPYSNQSDLLIEMSSNSLARLSGDITGISINGDRVDEAILNADTIINAALANVYQIPFSEPIDDLIRRISISLAIYSLHEFNSIRAIVPEEIVKRKDFALSELDKLAKGIYNLITARSNLSSENIITNMNECKRLFPNSLLDNYYE